MKKTGKPTPKPQTKRVLAAASQAFISLESQGQLTTGHLLLGILSQRRGVAIGILTLYFVMESLRSEIIAMMTDARKTDDESGVAEVFEIASEEARMLGAKRFGPEHVLVALARTKGLASTMLRSQKASPEAIRADIVMLSSTQPPSP